VSKRYALLAANQSVSRCSTSPQHMTLLTPHMIITNVPWLWFIWARRQKGIWDAQISNLRRLILKLHRFVLLNKKLKNKEGGIKKYHKRRYICIKSWISSPHTSQHIWSQTKVYFHSNATVTVSCFKIWGSGSMFTLKRANHFINLCVQVQCFKPWIPGMIWSDGENLVQASSYVFTPPIYIKISQLYTR
jgi:hypothetical protein